MEQPLLQDPVEIASRIATANTVALLFFITMLFMYIAIKFLDWKEEKEKKEKEEEGN